MLRTRYVPPAAAQTTGTEVGRETAPEPVARFPCIRVEMHVSAALPEPQHFADATIQRWLREKQGADGPPVRDLLEEKWMTHFAAIAPGEEAPKQLTINDPTTRRAAAWGRVIEIAAAVFVSPAGPARSPAAPGGGAARRHRPRPA